MLCKFRLQSVVTVKLIGGKGKLTEDSDRGMASKGWGASPYFRQGWNFKIFPFGVIKRITLAQLSVFHFIDGKHAIGDTF